MAAKLGYTVIGLLGYDCSLRLGVHWHGEHAKGLHNPRHSDLHHWRKEFHSLRRSLRDVRIVNCSRETELFEFEMMELEEFLGVYNAPFSGGATSANTQKPLHD